MSYQKTTGPIMANSHPGSYCGQDAYSDMLVTDYESGKHRERTTEPNEHDGTIECSGYDARQTGNFDRGGYEMDDGVRRLTPLECERLQGFPDGWTDIGDWVDTKGKKHKAADSPRYKALGNSIAIPFWFYLLRRISAQYERPATLGSLFSGIGGFEYCWTLCNGPNSCIWNSEIEPFPIAVTKKHFGDEDTNERGDLWKYLDQLQDMKNTR